MNWDVLSTWWREELRDDSAYEADIAPLLADLLTPQPGDRILDVGCGEGRTMAWLTTERVRAVGVDLSPDLLASAQAFGPVVRGVLPDLSWVRHAVFDAAVVSLVLEHLEDEATFFDELGRVVRPGGRLALVINHPIFTAPDSAPIQEDGWHW